jgi:two-component system nitrogen regulation response regulator GlnG
MSARDDRTLATGRGEALIPAGDELQWRITLAFHPWVTRIGEQCCIAATATPLVIGRHAPLFSPPFAAPASADAASAAGHARISRRALTLAPSRATAGDPGTSPWVLSRPPESSRLRLDGEEVEQRAAISAERARAGFTLLLGQSVLLHLRLAPALEPSARDARPVPGLAGVSAVLRRLHRDVRRVAASGDDVLLLGPTGTGKDVVARLIHELGDAAGQALVTVNMGALAPQLAAAELFGSRRGAFTGARDSRPGFFRQADGGTLFLDEIGDTPAEVQPLLLRAVQSRELQVVGGAVEKVSLRLIAATEQDPDAPGSSFRSALRHRLAAQELRLAPLAERREDIGPIALSALRRARGRAAAGWRSGELREPEAQRWAQCFELLHCHHWPGNVRELLQLLAQILAASDQRLELPQALLQRLGGGPPAPTAAAGISAAQRAGDIPAAKSLGELSDDEFVASWEAVDYQVAAMARRHHSSRQAVYRRLKSLHGCRIASEVPLGELLAVLDECRGDLAATARRLEVSAAGLQARLRASGVTTAAAASSAGAVHEQPAAPPEPRRSR